MASEWNYAIIEINLDCHWTMDEPFWWKSWYLWKFIEILCTLLLFLLFLSLLLLLLFFSFRILVHCCIQLYHSLPANVVPSTNGIWWTINDRMEPQCITCDIDSLLWSSRRLYKNCSYFDVYLSPSSSIATDYRVEHYVLECQGPTLPVAGNQIIHSEFSLLRYLAQLNCFTF